MAAESFTGSPHTHRLAHETSPYLQQHAGNPVEWYPWGDEALARARREDKPILLSIGYSACHWCHVMAHESFEDEETAAVMNARFINIKVDREERPDLDRIYQGAHQLLMRRPGGWPLTMFLTPDQTPFAGGTYFPREPRHGLPAFKDILNRVADFYRDRRAEIAEQNRSLLHALSQLGPGEEAAGLISDAPIRTARSQLLRSVDRRHGGFGGAPKFPHSQNLELLLRLGLEDEDARGAALHALRAMARGGLYDQLGGGFFRYSVDERWEIPHFEKMLYDNGPLLSLYVDGWQLSGDPLFREVAVRTAEWAIREMQSAEGGFYATLDADSEGREGKFYLWTPEEARTLLEDATYREASAVYGLDGAANFEGRWHLQRHREPDSAERLEQARVTLLAARERRTRPGRDEKVLTAWNALLVSALAKAGQVFERPEFVRAAERALDFVQTCLVQEGRLLATYKDGVARLPAYLDDHAFLLKATLDLLQVRWRGEDLRFARTLAASLINHFEDTARGGFYFTADDHESLIVRPKSYGDESLPSGNGIAALALARLGHLIGDTALLEAAERALRSGWEQVMEYPSAHGAMLLAIDEYLQPPETVVLRGETEALRPWLERVNRRYAPRRLVLPLPPDAADLPDALAARRPLGKGVAYICAAHHCSPPLLDPEAL